MRLVHANPFFFPRLGGIERRIYHLGRELARRGHDVTVLTGSNGPEDGPGSETVLDGVRVVRLASKRLPWRWDPPVTRTPGVRAALERERPDLVDFHYRWAPEWTRAVERATVAARPVPWVFTWHNQYGEGSGVLRPLSLLNDHAYRRRVQAGARAIVCVSRYIEAELRGRAFEPSRLAVVENGSQEPVPGGPEWQDDDGRAVPQAPYFVAVGRLTPEKGNDQVLRAFAHAVGLGCDARLVLCGRGPELARLQALAAQLGIAARVTFGGWVPEATKWRLLRGAVAMVHMARFESYGIAVAEATVAGLPVVACDVGGVAEVFGDAGVLVPAAATREAGEAMARLAADAAARDALAARARARAPSMAWAAVARRMEAVYEAALRA